MIEVRGLRKRLGGHWVLDGVDLAIHPGESIVIMGRSGSGKSVLLKHIIGLMKPDEGTIDVDGGEITSVAERDLSDVRRKFGMLFQSAALFDSMTVGDNVALPLREHTKLPADEIRRRVAERLEWVGLEGIEKKKPSDLSGGMRKRVGLARAIVMDPKYILYDEPTTGLDPIMADVIDRLVRSLQRRMGVTSVIVTHDIASAYKIADRIAMLHEGKIVFTGTVEETRTTRDPLVRQFLEGSSEGPIRV
jgi:phospholipid/cholesterol/gamma-HCH transport system ATP-binding protein